jgi:2-phospho-L-lactate guanylyltransferase
MAASDTLPGVRIIAIPVKSLTKSKRRLSPVFTPLERGALTLAMLEDVLDVTLALPGWETWVVSPDEAVLEIAVRRGVRPVVEDKPPLSGAVRQVEREAVEAGADALAVLLGDVVMATPEALSNALHTLGPVVVAPDESREGSNLLLRRPPKAIPARFGPGSLAKHQEAAAAKGLPVSLVEQPELAFDLDGPSDILALVDARISSRTLSALLQMQAPQRIPRVS